MSVLVILEPTNGKLNKGAFEIATYAAKTAKGFNTQSKAVILGSACNAAEVGSYGIDEVYNVPDTPFDSKVYTSMVCSAAQKLGSNIILFRHNSTAKNIAARVAVRLEAGIVSGVNVLPSNEGGVFTVQRGVFSGKAKASYAINTNVRVLTIMGNTIQPELVGSSKEPQALDIFIPAATTKVIERQTVTGIVPLPEAELVVSAGRGMKGPENWGIVEELADVLGATTACSRPVADTHWRPHHEHVGQTGVAIRPNLYIAIGISGAIQHLAGVNSSKTIVVINKDPEAPFFKAADYGVVGDLFDVVPKLTAAIKKMKGV